MKVKIYPLKDRLKYALEYRNMRPVDLCEKTEISQSTMSQYLSGYAEPKKARLAKIANTLNVEPTWLMGIGDMGPEECDAWNLGNERLNMHFNQSNNFRNFAESIGWSIQGYSNEEGFDEYKIKKEGVEINITAEEYLKLLDSSETFIEKRIQELVRRKIDPTYKEERRYDNEYAIDIPITYPKTDYLTGLSAGTGLYVFDDIPTQVIQVPAKYKSADFVIGVSGNSMEPTYKSGDKVAVKKAPTINVGEIGVFMIDGNGYIKELGKDKLISHNKEYDDIGINSNTTCIGKVLGKI